MAIHLNNKNLSSVDIFAIVIGSIAITISTVQTARGWNMALGFIFLTILFSIIVSGTLIFLNLKLREYKKRGLYLKLIVIMIFYILFTGISFTGNFNAFYTGYITEELYRNQLEHNRKLINEFNADAEEKLNANKAFITKKVKKFKTELRAEILYGTEGERGCGPICQELLDSIGKYIAEPRTPATNLTNQKTWKFLKDRIDYNLQEKIFSLDSMNRSMKVYVQEKSDSALAIIRNGLEEKSKNGYESAFVASKEIYSTMKSRFTGKIDKAVSYPSITFDNQNIGKFGFAYKQAAEDLYPGEDGETRGGLMAVIILASLIFDLLVPSIILIFTPVDKRLIQKRDQDNSWRISGGERIENTKYGHESFDERVKNSRQKDDSK